MPLQCSTCEEQFATQSDLEHHRVKVNDLRKFPSAQEEYLCVFLGYQQVNDVWQQKTEIFWVAKAAPKAKSPKISKSGTEAATHLV